MSNSDLEMKSYYRKRAPIHDDVYSYPERQKDLRYLETYIPPQFSGRAVLEIAAGTGYWTQFIANQAQSLLATDATQEALEQIAQREIQGTVLTQVMDAYSLNSLDQTFNGCFAGFWLSHVPREKLKKFIESIHGRLEPGSVVVFIDNSIAQCDRLPIVFEDELGNSFQDRILKDGSIHRVLKNFPTASELESVTSKFGENQKYLELDNFWLFQYTAT